MERTDAQRTQLECTCWNVLIGILLVGFTLIFFPSCVHEPLLSGEPDIVDTTSNPIDTLDEDITGTPCNPDTVYFSKDILPILKSNCAKSGCHDAITHEEGYIMDNFQNVMSGDDLVRPYDLDDSELFEVITENDHDKRMPPPPNERLTPEQVSLIGKWILQGAQDLTCDEFAGSCNTTAVSYSSYVKPLLTTYCTGCHSGTAPSGNILLNSYAEVRKVALDGRLAGAISWSSGYTPMPQGSDKLSDCKIEKIKAWINDGALDN